MMKNATRRLLSGLLSFLMAATLAVTPALAVETLTFDLSVDDANILQVSTGDIITVTFRIRSEGGCLLSTMQNEAEYDSRFFELEDSSPAVTETGMAVGDTRTTGQRIVKYSMLTDEEMALSDNAEFGSFRLRVIAVRGTTTVRNSESYAYNKNGAYAVSKSDLTVSIAGHPENPVQYTLRYHANGGEGSMPDQIFWEDEPQNLSRNAFTRNGYSFDGWAESENGEVTYRDGQSVLNLTDHDGAVIDLYAVWKARGAGVSILDSETRQPVSDAVVTARRGNHVYATATYDSASGLYRFNEIAAGLYNLVAERGRQIVSRLEQIDDSASITLTLPQGNVSSQLEVKGSDTPNIIAGNLDLEAVSQARGGNRSLKILMEAEQRSETQILNGADAEEKEAARGIEALKTQKSLVFFSFNVSLVEQDNAGMERSRSALETTLNALEIVVPLALGNKSNVGVYRYHNGTASRLNALSQRPASDAPNDGTFYADVTNSLLYIFASQFSLYAIAYDTEAAQPVTPIISSGGGGGGGSSGGGPYAITIEPSEHGNLKADRTTAASGTKVTVTADSVDNSYQLDGVTVTGRNDKAISVTEKDGKYSFTMPSHEVTVTGNFILVETQPVQPPDDSGNSDDSEDSNEPDELENPFIDVMPDNYFYDAVLWAVKEGVTQGKTATLFEPRTSCTRANMVTFLWRAVGSPKPTAEINPFTDVAQDRYYYDAVLWAVENDITRGITSTSFRPDEIVTRAQAVTFLYRMDGSESDIANPFTDVAQDRYYYDAVLWAYEQGITQGITNTTFAPMENCLRGQIVSFLYRKFAA